MSEGSNGSHGGAAARAGAPPDGAPVIDAAQAEEIAELKRRLRGTRPVATWVFLGTILVVFGLQWLWGRLTIPSMVRMGANVPEMVRAGEWWRMGSAAFLHGSLLHLGFNSYVLYALGSFLERVLGRSRLVVLLVASAFAGGLATTLADRASVSVGASGALWGMLAAHAVLAFRPNSGLPAVVLPGVRKAAVLNLVINVLASFQPQVDGWAHLGGGLVGGALLLTGVLARPLRPSGTAGAQGVHRRTLGAAAAVLAATLVASLALAWATDRPWSLAAAAADRARRPVPGTELTVEVPTALQAHALPGGGGTGFGRLDRDPLVVVVAALPSPATEPSPDDAAGFEQEAIDALTGQVPPGLERLGPPTAVPGAAHPTVVADLKAPSGARLRTLLRLTPRGVLRVEVGWWPDLVDGERESLRVLDSVR